MYYVLFHYQEGRQALGVQGFKYDSDVISFLHEEHKEIEVHRIIEVAREYRLGLIVTDEYIKSILEPEEEPESLVPIEVVDNAKAILREKKRKLKELETEEPSAIEEATADTDKGLTDEEEVEKQIDEADGIIEREKLRQEQKKKGWKLCTKCNSNRVAPWNKKQICSPCQAERKTNRPYTRSKEFSGL